MNGYTFRVLPPAGGFASPAEFFAAKTALHALDEGDLVSAAAKYISLELGYSERKLLPAGSGKAALFKLFQFWGRNKTKPILGVSAYTCPDIAVAALRAGWQVQPLEINERTLEILPESVRSQTLTAVILSNLYGLPDSVDWREPHAPAENCLLIDDACQAALSARARGPVGTAGDAGILSFGRGKALPGVGGGALLLPPDAALEASADTRPSVAADLLDCSRAALYWLLERPALYRFPASLPFLKLGQTNCRLTFSLAGVSTAQAVLAAAQARRAANTVAVLHDNARRLDSLLAALPVVRPLHERSMSGDNKVVLTRYPLLLSDRPSRDGCLQELQRAGLGASASYPKVLGDFDEIGHALLPSAVPRARTVAERIITLPVHRYVREEDAASMVGIIEKWLS